MVSCDLITNKLAPNSSVCRQKHRCTQVCAIGEYSTLFGTFFFSPAETSRVTPNPPQKSRFLSLRPATRKILVKVDLFTKAPNAHRHQHLAPCRPCCRQPLYHHHRSQELRVTSPPFILHPRRRVAKQRRMDSKRKVNGSADNEEERAMKRRKVLAVSGVCPFL
jgi:hypothetical protein